jgi:hypothetical protein
VATYNQAIDDAHRSLNDALRTRYPDTVTFPYAQDGVREVAMLRPDLFVTTRDLACTPGEVEQTVAPDLYILDVLNVVGGSSVTKADLDTMRRYQRSWMTDTADEAENWFPIINDQTKRPQANFFIYPKAPAAQSLRVQTVSDPLATLPSAATETMPIPDQLLPAIASYIIFRCEMVDDEHVVSQRAQAAYTNFATILGVSEKNRKTIVQEGRPH